MVPAQWIGSRTVQRIAVAAVGAGKGAGSRLDRDSLLSCGIVDW